jgi:hypothetical protein
MKTKSSVCQSRMGQALCATVGVRPTLKTDVETVLRSRPEAL